MAFWISIEMKIRALDSKIGEMIKDCGYFERQYFHYDWKNDN
jgi:hypothetical protein